VDKTAPETPPKTPPESHPIAGSFPFMIALAGWLCGNFLSLFYQFVWSSLLIFIYAGPRYSLPFTPLQIFA